MAMLNPPQFKLTCCAAFFFASSVCFLGARVNWSAVKIQNTHVRIFLIFFSTKFQHLCAFVLLNHAVLLPPHRPIPTHVHTRTHTHTHTRTRTHNGCHGNASLRRVLLSQVEWLGKGYVAICSYQYRRRLQHSRS